MCSVTSSPKPPPPFGALIEVGEIINSGQFAARLSGARGLSPEAARQVISRTKDPAVWTLPIRLPGRGRLFALRDSRVDDEFYRKVASLLVSSRPGVARTISALLDRGVLLRSDAQRLLAAPLRKRSSRNPTYDFELGYLKDLQICRVDAEHTSLERLTRFGITPQQSHDLARSRRSQVVVEEHLTAMLLQQFREQNIVSWNGASSASNGRGTVLFNDHAFGGFGFSFLNPLMRRKEGEKPKSAPAVIDVHARECDIHDVESLLHRIDRVGGNPKARLPVLGVLAAFDFEKPAWSVAKKRGLLVINLRQTLGERALNALIQAETLFRMLGESPAPSSSEEIAALAETLESLRVHPHVSLLRSIGLEVATAALVQSDGFPNVSMRESFPWQDSHREVDVLGKRNGAREICIVECKGEYEGKSLGGDRVKRFFTETVPAVLKQHSETEKCRAEIWTTGEVEGEARDVLAGLSLSSKVKPRLLGKADLLALVPPNLEPCKELLAAISLPN